MSKFFCVAALTVVFFAFAPAGLLEHTSAG